jgi:hypothetical protein
MGRAERTNDAMQLYFSGAFCVGFFLSYRVSTNLEASATILEHAEIGISVGLFFEGIRS